MANFKVVFRSDNQGADTSPGWEPGCPLLVNAVQVSRNTDTGQCYLQLKLSNISGATVTSFKLHAAVSYVDGTSGPRNSILWTPAHQPARRIAPGSFTYWIINHKRHPSCPLRLATREEWLPPGDPHWAPFRGALLVLGETAAAGDEPKIASEKGFLKVI